jgi:hypothetical protein
MPASISMEITPSHINKLLSECEADRNDWIESAEHNWRLVYEQNRVKPPSEVSSGTPYYDNEENYIRAKLLDLRSALLKNKPTFRVQATKPSDIKLSDDVSAVAFKRWKESGAHGAFSRSQMEVGYTGLAIVGLNRIEVRPGVYKEKVVNIPRIDFWHDTRVLHVGEGWCCYRSWRTLDDLKDYFGKRKIPIVTESEVNGNENTLDLLSPPNAKTETDIDEDAPPDSWGDDLYALYQFWAHPSMTDDGKWEMIHMVNNKIVERGHNPFEREYNVMTDDGENEVRRVGHGLPPFVAHRCYFKPDSKGYIGFYDVEGIAATLETVQWDLTEAARSLMIITRRAAQPPTIEEIGSTPEESAAREYGPGEIIPYLPDKPPPIPMEAGLNSTIPTFTKTSKTETMSELSGIRPFMTGQEPRGTSHTPVGTVAFAQEASFVRMYDIVDTLDDAIIKMGQLILGNMQQFTDAGEWIDVNTGGKASHVRWTQAHVDTEFNLEVVSGMTTILRDIGRQEIATQLYQTVSIALASQQIPVLEAAKQWLIMLDEPAGHGYLPIIEKQIEALQGMVEQGVVPPEQQQLNFQQQGQQGVL